MLTKWGKKVVAMSNLQDNANQIIPNISYQTSGSAMVEAKNSNGDTRYLPVKAYSTTFNLLKTSPINSSGVAFGSGNTPATENDYTLENMITGLSATTPAPETYYDKENWKYCVRLDYAISNNTGSDVTISEIGLFRTFYAATTRGNNASNANTGYFLFDRTVLSQPITIPNGGAATVRYEFVYDA